MPIRELPSDLDGRWFSGEHVGANKPNMYVEYRVGRFIHRYGQWEGPPVTAYFAGGYVDDNNTAEYWQNYWTPNPDPDWGEWAELPNVGQVDLNQQFENAGTQIATVQMENIAYPESVGVHGPYHRKKRGYYAPYRGMDTYTGTTTNPGLPLTEGGRIVPSNEWLRKLNQGGQVRIWQGYGISIAPVFTGLVDDIDLTSQPDRITLTSRDFTQMLTDLRVFGWNKEPRIKIPVTFIDSFKADSTKKVGYDSSASSSYDGGHTASAALTSDSDDFWLSDGHQSADFTEWIQIHLPEGRYTDFFMYPRYKGMDLYVSLYVTDRDGAPPLKNGEPIATGWVEGDDPSDIVPGANGGIPYLKLRKGVDNVGRYVNIDGNEYVVGQGSRLRLSWRHLDFRNDVPGVSLYYAGVNKFFANRRTLNPIAKKQHWIVIDDVSDMVKVVLRWAGFKDWAVETSGVRLKDQIKFSDKDTLMDVITKAQELTGYVFFMGEPHGSGEDDDNDLGMPTFRRPSVLDQRIVPRGLIRDTNNLTGISVKDTDQPRSYIIRARGKITPEDEGGQLIDAGGGVRRLMYVFKPPWWRRLGGVVTHLVFTNELFRTLDDCKAACFQAALNEALLAEKATVECPGNPAFELDSHAAVHDVGTAMAQRLWISERQSTFHVGEQNTYVMTLGGALEDTPDIKTMRDLIRTANYSGE